MVKIRRIEHHEELMHTLRQDILATEKQKIVVQAGHFPIRYDPKTGGLLEDLKIWGDFSLYTFEIGCSLLRFASDKGKEAELIIICDDRSYSWEYEHERTKEDNLVQWRSARNKFYRKRSETLPAELTRILEQYALNEAEIKRHNHNRSGRKACLYHSEAVLMSSSREISDGCTREYVALLEGEFDRQKAYLIGFVPFRCKDKICEALDIESGIESSHVFMDTADTLATRVRLYSCAAGVNYRKEV